MEYTEQQKQEFKTEFARRRRRQIVVTIPAVVVIIAWVLMAEDAMPLPAGVPQGAALVVFFAAVFGMLVFSLFNWRCPACRSYLGKGISPRFCRHCGVALR